MALTARLDGFVESLLRTTDLGDDEVWHGHVRVRLDHGTATRNCLLGLVRAHEIRGLVEHEHRSERIEGARATDDPQRPPSVVERPPCQSVTEQKLRLHV